MKDLTQWLSKKWELEKEIDSPDYVVGLGSGVLRTRDGELTLASKNVVDKCLSLFCLYTHAEGIVLIGGKPWKYPPVADVELMHQRLVEQRQSMGTLEVPPEKVVILHGNNTHEQIIALRHFLYDFPRANAIIVCPGMQSRRLRAILRKQNLLKRAGITTVENGCEYHLSVERFRWSGRRYLLREIMACIHHRFHGWI